MLASVKSLFVILAATAASLAGGWHAHADDHVAVHSAIERQIDAFQHDDAARAYGLASPGIREHFADAQTFLTMVRTNYPAVYRPRLMFFGASSETDSQALQIVRVIDQDGEGWAALFSLERQNDGSWQVAGCMLVRQPSTDA